MDIDQKCKEVMERKGWSQRQLADELAISDKNLISMRKGRRPMPPHALARLERLRGVDDASIVDQIIRTAACVALAVVLLFGTGAENRTIASDTYAAQTGGNTNYRYYEPAECRTLVL